MRRLITALVFLFLIQGVVAAQESTYRFGSDPFKTTQDEETTTTPSTVEDEASESDSSYQSWPSLDAQSLVQKKAIFRSEQRQLRTAARQWYGFSQSRPVVVAVPYMTNYHPLWVGRHWHPYYSWYGTMWR